MRNGGNWKELRGDLRWLSLDSIVCEQDRVMSGALEGDVPGTNSSTRMEQETIGGGILLIGDRGPEPTSAISTQSERREDNVAPEAAPRNKVAVSKPPQPAPQGRENRQEAPERVAENRRWQPNGPQDDSSSNVDKGSGRDCKGSQTGEEKDKGRYQSTRRTYIPLYGGAIAEEKGAKPEIIIGRILIIIIAEWAITHGIRVRIGKRMIGMEDTNMRVTIADKKSVDRQG